MVPRDCLQWSFYLFICFAPVVYGRRPVEPWYDLADGAVIEKPTLSVSSSLIGVADIPESTNISTEATPVAETNDTHPSDYELTKFVQRWQYVAGQSMIKSMKEQIDDNVHAGLVQPSSPASLLEVGAPNIDVGLGSELPSAQLVSVENISNNATESANATEASHEDGPTSKMLRYEAFRRGLHIITACVLALPIVGLTVSALTSCACDLAQGAAASSELSNPCVMVHGYICVALGTHWQTLGMYTVLALMWLVWYLLLLSKAHVENELAEIVSKG